MEPLTAAQKAAADNKAKREKSQALKDLGIRHKDPPCEGGGLLPDQAVKHGGGQKHRPVCVPTSQLQHPSCIQLVAALKTWFGHVKGKVPPISLCRMAAATQPPYYKTLPPPSLKPRKGKVSALLPQISKVLGMEATSPGSLWVPSLSFEDNVAHCLSWLNSQLDECSKVLPGDASFPECDCFARPLEVKVGSSFAPVCMHFMPGVPKLGGYVKMVLGAQGHSFRVHEMGHRFILWAHHGPPPPSLLAPICLHICGDKECGNPCHLVWGNHNDNRAAPGSPVYTTRLEQQRRPAYVAPWSLVEAL